MAATYTEAETIRALEHLVAEIYARIDDRIGPASEQFPEPAEWIALWKQALSATRDAVAREHEPESQTLSVSWSRWYHIPRMTTDDHRT